MPAESAIIPRAILRRMTTAEHLRELLEPPSDANQTAAPWNTTAFIPAGLTIIVDSPIVVPANVKLIIFSRCASP